MTTFTWQVTNLQVINTPVPDTVTMTGFTVNGTEGDLTGSVSYAVNLLPIDEENYTHFAHITPDAAVQWTKEALGEERVAAMEAEVQKQIDDQKIEQPATKDLPW
jgi:hypothetical protein